MPLSLPVPFTFPRSITSVTSTHYISQARGIEVLTPRSNAHTSFPSLPPTPPGEAETTPFFDNIGAAPRRTHLHTRRYLAPVFVHGEVLPFVIVQEEEHDQDQAKPNAVVHSSPDDEGREGGAGDIWIGVDGVCGHASSGTFIEL